jgi:tRNA dimethylallyltransferase
MRRFLQEWQAVLKMAVFPEILVILGPTASGKSALAMAAAQHVGAEILSIDSMQIYKGMEIGTAKPSGEEQARVKHHLIDVVEPSESFSVSQFVERADAVIADAKQRGVPLIATGGTPMYYKALFEGLFEGPGTDESVRQRLRVMSNESLHARLSEVDPASAARIHVNDTKRLIRALEVYEISGKPISALQNEWGTGEHRHRALWVGLDWEKEALNRRINARVRDMMNAGWLEETRRLVERYPNLSKTAGEATGYQELIAHLRGEMSLEEAVEQIKIATRQLARRQVKWFRRFEKVTWLRGDAPGEENMRRVVQLWTTADAGM